MSAAVLEIKIGADVQDLVRGVQTAENTIGSLQAKLKDLRTARLEIGDPAKLAAINQQIAEVTASLQQLKNIGKQGFDDLGIKIKIPTPQEVAVPFEIIDNRSREAEELVSALNIELTKLGTHKAPSFEQFNFGQQAGSQSFGNALGGLKQQADEAGKSVQFIDTKLGDFAKGSVNEAKASVRLLEAEMAAFSAQERKSPIGRETAASLVLARKELVNVSKEAGITGETTSNAFSKAFGSIRQLAYILPGIGIAGIFNLAFEAISKVVSGIGSANEGFDKQAAATKRAGDAAKDLIKTLNDLKTSEDIIGQATGSQAGSIERVQALAAAVRDSNLTYKERQTALEELKETNKAYFGDLTLEEKSLRTLTQRVNEYSNALVAEAVVKGFTDEISKTTIEFNKQADAVKVLKDKLDAAQKAQNDFKPVAAQAGGRGGGTGTSDAVLQQNKLAAAVNLARVEFNKQRDGLFDLATALSTLKPKMDQAVQDQLKFKLLKDSPGSGKAAVDTLSATERALQEIAKLTEELGKADTRPLFERLAQSIDPNQAELLKTKIALVIRNNTRDGINAAITKEEVDLLYKKLQKLLNPDLTTRVDTIIEVDPHIRLVSDAFAKEGGIGPLLDSVLRKLPALKTDIKVDPQLVLDKVQFAKTLEHLSEGIKADLINISSSELGNFGEIIGDAINGQGADLDGAIKNIASILGEGLKTIGKLYIETAIAIALAKKTFSALAISNPIAAIAVGIGLEILGTVLVNSVQKKSAHAFAEGGIVTQSTYGLVGEAGPEAIIPLQKLDRIINQTQGAGTMRIDFRGRLQGNDIRLSQLRTVKQQNMV